MSKKIYCEECNSAWVELKREVTEDDLYICAKCKQSVTCTMRNIHHTDIIDAWN